MKHRTWAYQTITMGYRIRVRETTREKAIPKLRVGVGQLRRYLKPDRFATARALNEGNSGRAPSQRPHFYALLRGNKAWNEAFTMDETKVTRVAGSYRFMEFTPAPGVVPGWDVVAHG